MADAAFQPCGFGLSRRALGLGVAAALAPRAGRAFQIPVGRRIQCRVFRHGADIGQATYDFERQGDGLDVRTSIEIRVKLGFIVLFRFSHANVERWRGDVLMGFNSHTNDNGNAHFANVQRVAGGLAVTGSRTRPYTAPGDALGTTYWNPRTLTDPLINAEDGRLLKVAIADEGQGQAMLAGGRMVPARQYGLSGDLRGLLWYDTDMVWTGMKYIARDGSELLYEKVA